MPVGSDQTPRPLIRLFGAPRLDRVAEPRILSVAVPADRLLVLVAFHREVTARTLAELVWPEGDEELQRWKLNTTLSRLRRSPGGVGQAVRTRRGARWLDPEQVDVDLHLLRAALDPSDPAVRQDESRWRALLQEATDLCQGPPLEGWEESYEEDWPASQQQRCENELATALARLAELSRRQGDGTAAREALQRLQAIRPDSPETTFLHLEILADEGRKERLKAVWEAYLEALGESPPPVQVERYEALRARALKRSAEPAPTPGPHSEPPGNLPVPPKLFGRGVAAAECAALLAAPDTRLLTLWGPPGVGKTVLGRKVASDQLAGYPDGVWFADLTDLSDPGLLLSALPATGLLPRPASPYDLETVIRLLRDRRCLLVLDNCEHLEEACAHLTAALIRRCPELKVLATSLSLLGVREETGYEVAALDYPEEAWLTPTEEGLGRIRASAAVELFLDRAQRQGRRTPWSDDELVGIGRICSRLDGIPLALEMAAAATATQSVGLTLRQLEERFRYLRSWDRDKPPKQQTLQAALKWAYGLLDDPAKTLFACLSVFRGDFAAEAVGPVCGASLDQPATGPIALLARRSLLQAFPERDRYRMAETMRAYGGLLLETETPEAIGGLRDRHLAYYTDLAESADRGLGGAEQARYLASLDCELSNLREAVKWGLSKPNKEPVVRCLVALRRFFDLRGYWSEGLAYLEQALADTGSQPQRAEVARALDTAGVLAWRLQDRPRARRYASAALRQARSLGDRRIVAQVLNSLGNLQTGRRALRLYEASLALFREEGDRARIAALTDNLGITHQAMGHLQQAASLLQEGLDLRREIGNAEAIANSCVNLGQLFHSTGDYARAEALLTEGLTLRRRLGHRRGVGNALSDLGFLALEREQYDAARAYLEESLEIRRRLDDRLGMAQSLNLLGMLAYSIGEYSRSSELQEQSLRLAEEIGSSWDVAASLNNLTAAQRHLGNYGQAGAYVLRALSGCVAVGDPRPLADCLDECAQLLVVQGDPEAGTQLFAAAQTLRKGVGHAICPPQEAENAAALEARAGLDPARLALAWSQGCLLSAEEAVELARSRIAAVSGAAQPPSERPHPA